MKKQNISFWICSLSLALFLGCGGPADTSNPTSDTPSEADHADHDDHAGHGDHDHPSHGPHNGDLIELGDEEFHAELVDNHDKGTVTIYILDSSAKKTVAIEAKEIVVNLKHEGKGEQFKLVASPDQGDAAGLSSRFVSSDQELADELDHDHAEATLVLTIKGKQYRGEIHHDHHGHDDHGHDH